MFRVASRRASYRDEASEDRLLVLPLSGGTVVLAVADGVGGQPGGGLAAQFALDTIRELAPTLLYRRSQTWQRLLRAIDNGLVQDPEAGLTTLVVICLSRKKLMGASVGDSEAWWVTKEGHFDLTEAQNRKPYLGSGRAAPVPFELKLPSDGTLVMATDGLFKYADPLAVTDTVRIGLEEAPEALQTLVEGPGGRLYDDLAIVVAQADKIPLWTRFLSR